MASPEANRIRRELGLDYQPPVIIDSPYANPTTPDELAANSVAVLHNRAELGEITDEEASKLMREIDSTRAEWGNGWADRYGPLPNY